MEQPQSMVIAESIACVVNETQEKLSALKAQLALDRERLKAAREAVLVEAYHTKKRLCRLAAENTGLDAWRLEATAMEGRYPKVRSLVYWKMFTLGYDFETIGKAFGRRSDVSKSVGKINAKIKANSRMRYGAESIFQERQ